MADQEFKLFYCEVGGVDYVVAALAAEQVLGVVKAEEGDGIYEQRDYDACEVKAMSEMDLDAKKLRSDEDGKIYSYREWLGDIVIPMIVSCSEW